MIHTTPRLNTNARARIVLRCMLPTAATGHGDLKPGMMDGAISIALTTARGACPGEDYRQTVIVVDTPVCPFSHHSGQRQSGGHKPPPHLIAIERFPPLPSSQN